MTFLSHLLIFTMNLEANSTHRKPMSKTVDMSTWKSDLKPGAVFHNDDIPAATLNFANKETMDMVVNRFKSSPVFGQQSK